MKEFWLHSMLCVVFLTAGYGNENPKGKLRSADDVLAGVTWAEHGHQGFSMKVWLSNQIAMGIEAWTPLNVPVEYCGVGIGLEYPAGECVEHLFAAGPMIGGIINGVRRVSQSYEEASAFHQFIPERKDTARDRIWYTSIEDDPYTDYNLSPPRTYLNTISRLEVDDDGDGNIDEDELDGTDNDGDWVAGDDDIGTDGVPDSLETGCKGGYDPVNNHDPAYDNYEPVAKDSCRPDPGSGALPFKNDKDRYTDKNGIPDHGEPHVDEDHGAASDRDYYMSATDTATSAPGAVGSNHFPMGVKIHMKSHAIRSSGGDGILPIDYYFANIGSNSISDAYVGFNCDFDIGPVNVANYFQHNYSAFDSVTHTAYTHNAQDRGSTPLGLTLLGQSRPLDSLQFVFQWYSAGTLGNIDSIAYTWLDGSQFGGSLIKPNQQKETPSDSRIFTSIGPFQLYPGEKVHAAYALVSGVTIDDMLRNARRAHRLYDAKYFVNPTAMLIDSGGSSPTMVKWDSVARSPFGLVTSYRVYYGTQSGIYTDSVSTTSLMATVGGLSLGFTYYYAVAAFDDQGNRSALSDELTNEPGKPTGLFAHNHQTDITLFWNKNADADLSGYNVYREADQSGGFVLLNSSLIDTNTYRDQDVWGDKKYRYKVTSVDGDGHESVTSEEVPGFLLPPARPAMFLVGRGKTFFRLNWLPNIEGDLAGYNVYRAAVPAGYVKLNSGLWQSTDYIDSTVQSGASYLYYVEAVDTTDAASTPTAARLVETAAKDGGILIVYQSGPPFGTLYDSLIAFYDYLLQGYPHTVKYLFDPDQAELENYSTVLWLYERTRFSSYDDFWRISAYPAGLKGYLLGGGKLLLMGRQLTYGSSPYWFQFLRDIFGMSIMTEANSGPTFAGATGIPGFPLLAVDSAKLISTGGRLTDVERFVGPQPQNVVYTYKSDPFDSSAEGKAVGVKAFDSSFSAYYMSFPLQYLDTMSAHALVVKVLTDFNEQPLAVDPGKSDKPVSFNLYAAYPNPFNPSTSIAYDLPELTDVKITIHDILGREVAVIAEGKQFAGHYEVRWDASRMASGVYFCRMIGVGSSTSASGHFIGTKKILLVR